MDQRLKVNFSELTLRILSLTFDNETLLEED